MKTIEYNIRIQIDADKELMVYDSIIFENSKQIARALIQESNFTTVQKRVVIKQEGEQDG